MVNKKVLAILGSMDFQEYMEEKTKCPKCKEETLTRHIRKEPQQKWRGRWFVEFCDNCDYWDCGFTPKRFKPSENIRIIKDNV